MATDPALGHETKMMVNLKKFFKTYISESGTYREFNDVQPRTSSEFITNGQSSGV